MYTLTKNCLSKLTVLDERSNYFTWQQIVGDNSYPLNLKEGRHILTIENVAGFNAINMFGIIPVGQMADLQEKVSLIANKTGNVYFLEAESSFYNDGGRPINENDNHTSLSSSLFYLPVVDDSISNTTYYEEGFVESNLKPNFTYSGQIRVPEDSNLLKLWFLTRSQNNSYVRIDNEPGNLNSTYTDPDNLIESLKIFPSKKKQDIIVSNYDRSGTIIPLAELRKPTWLNDNKETLSTTIDTDDPIAGNGSLRIDVRQGNESEWSTNVQTYFPLMINHITISTSMFPLKT